MRKRRITNSKKTWKTSSKFFEFIKNTMMAFYYMFIVPKRDGKALISMYRKHGKNRIIHANEPTYTCLRLSHYTHNAVNHRQ